MDLKRRESYRGRKKENLYGWLENSRPLHKSERFWISRLLASRISTRFTYRHLERRSVTIFNHSFSGKKVYRLTNQKPSYMKFISVTFLRVREKGTCRQPLNWLPRRRYARMLSGEHLPLHAQYCRLCSWRSGLWVTNFEYYFALKKNQKKKGLHSKTITIGSLICWYCGLEYCLWGLLNWEGHYYLCSHPRFFSMKPLGVFNCFFQLHHRYPFTLPGGERGTVRAKFLTQHNDRISTQISRSGVLRANH